MVKIKIARILLLTCTAFVILRGIDRSIHSHSGRPFLSNIFVPSSQPISAECAALPPEILDQKFFYLDKGAQAYAFISEDQRYVLKFYKLHIYGPNSFLSYLPFGSFHDRWQHKKQKYAFTLQSVRTAFELFKGETGLVYAHLSPTSALKKSVEVVDRRGKQHRVELDRTLFVVQKRADLPYAYIATLMQKGDVEGAKRALASIFTLLEKFGKDGVTDNDVIVRKNIGFIDGKAAQIDVGKMRIEPSRIGTDAWRYELHKFTASLKVWLEKNYPELLPHFEKLLKDNALS
jgi:hypothetical protein